MTVLAPVFNDPAGGMLAPSPACGCAVMFVTGPMTLVVAAVAHVNAPGMIEWTAVAAVSG